MILQQQIQKLSQDISEIYGWDFSKNRMDHLQLGLMETARELGIGATQEELIGWMKSLVWRKKELEILCSHLTVGETYFFREREWLDVFQNHILPEITASRRGSHQHLKIWSAGCSSGEEPYSLAILLNESIPDIRNWELTLLGTDINPLLLEKAKRGQYTSWSFRETSPAERNLYFTPAGNSWQIHPNLMEMVRFATLNLADSNYPSEVTGTRNVDVIFCRNVLMYFTPAQIQSIVGRFYQSLNEGGWLIVSAVELNDPIYRDFTPVRFGPHTVYKKIKKQPVQDNKPGMPEAGRKVPSGSAMTLKQFREHLNISKRTSLNASPAKVKAVSDEEKARRLFNDGKYEQCAAFCEALLMNTTGNIEILTLLVRSKASLGQIGEAAWWAEVLTGDENVKADHLYLLASILMEANKVSWAKEALKKALFLDPNHLMSHFLMVSVASHTDDRQGALRSSQNVKTLLDRYEDEDIVPGSDGFTAGRLRKILTTLT